MTDPARIVVMLSGEGSNFTAIADYADKTRAFQVCHVISDRADAPGVRRAQARGIAATVIERASGGDRDTHEAHVDACLQNLAPDVIAMAGYMRILGPALVGAWRGKMLNVHPSLLPKYRGLHTYRRALANGESEHGASVHFVTEELDGGPVIAQARTPIRPNETEATLRNTVQQMEYRLFPRVIDALCDGRLALGAVDSPEHSAILWRGAPLQSPLDPDALQARAA